MSHDYEPVRITLNLSSLTDCKLSANISFMKNVLSNVIGCSTILSQVSFKVPQRPTIYTLSFLIQFSSSNYLASCPL